MTLRGLLAGCPLLQTVRMSARLPYAGAGASLNERLPRDGCRRASQRHNNAAVCGAQRLVFTRGGLGVLRKPASTQAPRCVKLRGKRDLYPLPEDTCARIPRGPPHAHAHVIRAVHALRPPNVDMRLLHGAWLADRGAQEVPVALGVGALFAVGASAGGEDMHYGALVRLSPFQHEDKIIPSGDIDVTPRVVQLATLAVDEEAGDIIHRIRRNAARTAFVLPALHVRPHHNTKWAQKGL
eukprot:3076454-Rhodomonas_salina.1